MPLPPSHHLKPDAVIGLHTCGRIIGILPPEVALPDYMGHSYLDFVCPDYRPVAESCFRSALAGHASSVVEIATDIADEIHWHRCRWLRPPTATISVVIWAMRLSPYWGEVSRREREVVAALRACPEPKRAAASLAIAPKTLASHVRRIRSKCHLGDDLSWWTFTDRHG